MNELFSVSDEDIQNLNEYELPQLLRRLLHLEAIRNNIPERAVDVSLDIHIPDDGEDGLIKWNGEPLHTDYLPCNNIIFECKKRPKSPPISKYKSWVTKDKSAEIKSNIDKIHKEGGYYIIVINCSEKKKREKISAIRETYRDANKSYANEANIDIYDKNKIVEWTNKYIPAIILVKQFVGKQIPFGLKTVEMWQEVRHFQIYKYIFTKELEENIRTIQDVSLNHQNVIRITGPSGIGKTRLALEAFKNDLYKSKSISMRSSVVYIDSSFGSSEVRDCLNGALINKTSGTIVIDNCDLDLENFVLNEIQRGDSKISAVLIDSFPERNIRQGIGKINLKPLDNNVIIEILKQAYGQGYPLDKLEFVTRIVNGFPAMAVQLADAGVTDLYSIRDKEDDFLIDKLISGKYPADPKAKDVIKVCSLFSQIGFSGKMNKEFEYLRSELITVNGDVNNYISQFKARGIIEQYGRYIRVVPLPLALWLAEKWWKTRQTSDLLRTINLPFPGQLLDALCDRMSQIGYLDQAKKVVEELVGPTGPFGKPEVLLSERGSRLFRSLATVNPISSIKVLDSVITDLSDKELIDITSQRRNWLWTLEDLLYEESIYDTVIGILIRLALNENESYVNNSTGILLQSFQVQLSGTNTNLLKRLKVITTLINQGETEILLAIEISKSALSSGPFTQWGGVTSEKVQADKRYKPTSTEIDEYWVSIISALTNLMISKQDYLKPCLDAIAENFSSFLYPNLYKKVRKYFKEIHDNGVTYWRELLQKIISIKQYDQKRFSPYSLKFADTLFELFYPVNTVDKIDYCVINPPYHDIEKGDGSIVDLSKEGAESLGNECANDSKNWPEYLPQVLTNWGRNSYSFGLGIASAINNPTQFIHFIKDFLKGKNRDSINTGSITGFLNGITNRDSALVDDLLEEVSKSKELNSNIVDFTLAKQIGKSDLHRIVNTCNNYGLPIQEIRKLTYGSVLDHLHVKEVIKFVDQLCKVKDYNVVGIEILYMYALNDQNRLNECAKKMKELVLDIKIEDAVTLAQHEIHIWQDTVEKLLNSSEENLLAEFITQELLELMKSHDQTLSLDHTIKPIIKILFDKYFDIVWPKFSEVILSKKPVARRNLNWILESAPFMQSSTSLFESIPYEKILNWCKKHPDKAPLFVARNIDLFVQGNEKWELSKLAHYIINEYGDNQELLEELTLNLHNYSWTGSVVGYYRKQVEALKSLLDSDKHTVRKWAQNTIEYAEKRIKKEKTRDEEEKIGIYGSPYD